MISISIIIPALNEASNLEKLLPSLNEKRIQESEVIVVDAAGSSDTTNELCDKFQVTYIRSDHNHRAIQLNLGAAKARGEILYFLHADCEPPKGFCEAILKAVRAGVDFGSFSFRFMSDHPLLKINAYFTKKEGLFSGGGDQTLFIRARDFNNLGRYSEDLCLMEDFDLYDRGKRAGLKYQIIPKDVMVSARKYDINPYWKVNLVQFGVMLAYKLGLPQALQVKIYRKFLKHR